MTLAIPSRRGFLLGAGALLAAPAIVRVSALMPVSVVEEEGWRLLECAKASWTQIAISGKRPDWLDLTTLRDIVHMINGPLPRPMIVAAHMNFQKDWQA